MHNLFSRLPLQFAALATFAAASLAVTAIPAAAASPCDTKQIQVDLPKRPELNWRSRCDKRKRTTLLTSTGVVGHLKPHRPAGGHVRIA